jgi:drug/metabolite transporter (DMT)-like permease
VRVVQAGMVLWAVALVVLVFLGDRVDRVWTWTCVAALALGLLGLALMRGQHRSSSSG